MVKKLSSSRIGGLLGAEVLAAILSFLGFSVCW
jgi:hypothetical protein